MTQQEQYKDPETEAVNGIQPLLILVFTPGLFLLWHIQISCLKKENGVYMNFSILTVYGTFSVFIILST